MFATETSAASGSTSRSASVRSAFSAPAPVRSAENWMELTMERGFSRSQGSSFISMQPSSAPPQISPGRAIWPPLEAV